VTDAFVGSIPIDPGMGDTAGGLWSLEYGTGGLNGSPNVLYFTDGINGEGINGNGERSGLFGAIQAVPEPSTLALSGLALSVFGAGWWRRRRSARAAALAAA